jgi:hypothetical protein
MRGRGRDRGDIVCIRPFAGRPACSNSSHSSSAPYVPAAASRVRLLTAIEIYIHAAADFEDPTHPQAETAQRLDTSSCRSNIEHHAQQRKLT